MQSQNIYIFLIKSNETFSSENILNYKVRMFISKSSCILTRGEGGSTDDIVRQVFLHGIIASRSTQTNIEERDETSRMLDVDFFIFHPSYILLVVTAVGWMPCRDY